MVKCVLLFLSALILSCSIGETKEHLSTTFTQTNEISTIEWENQSFSVSFDCLQNSDIVFDARHSFRRIFDGSQGIDLWKFDIDQVGIWGINGEIPFDLMQIQQNSIAVLGVNAVLAKVFALKFPILILLPSIPNEIILDIMENYDGTLLSIQEDSVIKMKTDGIFWYQASGK
jgi:hypothetical protein